MNPALLKKRFGAFVLDFLVVYLLRYFYAILSFNYLLKNNLLVFIDSYKDKFGKIDFKKINTTQIEFLINSKFFKIFMIWFLTYFFVASIYHFFFLISKKSATLGQRFFNIYVVNFDKKKITKMKALFRSILLVLPWIFVFYIFIFNQLFRLSGKILLDNNSIIVIFFVFATWFDIALFTKNKLTFHDLSSKTMVVTDEPIYEYINIFIRIKNFFVFLFDFKNNMNSVKNYFKERKKWFKEFKNEVLNPIKLQVKDNDKNVSINKSKDKKTKKNVDKKKRKVKKY